MEVVTVTSLPQRQDKPGDALIPAACVAANVEPEPMAYNSVEQLRMWNVRVCMWVNFCSTVTTQMAAGPFLDIYMFKITGSNRFVGAVETARGIAQLLAAPFLGMLADRFDRYRLIKLQAILHAVPVALLATAIFLKLYQLLYLALPLFSVSNHFGNTVRAALLADNVEEGRRTYVMSRNFSMVYVGQATGPILQVFVLLAMGAGAGSAGGEDRWQLPELRITLLAGCVVYFFAEPASFLFRSVPPAFAPSTASASLAREACIAGASELQSDWRQERVLQGCGCWTGVPKMWATPVAVEATFFFILLGSGMSTKFYPLFFARDFGLTPFGLCLLGAAEPLGVAVLSRLNPCITRRLGRARTATLFMCLSPLLLLGVIKIPQIALVAPLFVLRTATARAYIPLFQAIVATCVPSRHRGKFAAFNAFRMSFFSASAFVGAWLADAYGSYRPAFFVTAIWQWACIVLFAPVLLWLPGESDF